MMSEDNDYDYFEEAMKALRAAMHSRQPMEDLRRAYADLGKLIQLLEAPV